MTEDHAKWGIAIRRVGPLLNKLEKLISDIVIFFNSNISKTLKYIFIIPIQLKSKTKSPLLLKKTASITDHDIKKRKYRRKNYNYSLLGGRKNKNENIDGEEKDE